MPTNYEIARKKVVWTAARRRMPTNYEIPEPWEKRMLRHAMWWLDHCVLDALPAGRPIIFAPHHSITNALWILRNLYDDKPWDSGWMEAEAVADAVAASMGKRNYGAN